MRTRLLSRGARIAALLVLAVTPPARAASTGASANIAVALIAEDAAVQPGRPFHVGLRMRMRHGWHTYWRNPGDAGAPLDVTWDLPDGFSAGPIQWPAPERIPTESLMSYGYHGEVILPIEITPPDRIESGTVTLRGAFEWLECSDVCLAGAATLDLSLPVRPAPPRPGPAAPAFAGARSRLPAPLPAGWTVAAEAGPRAISLSLRVPSGTSARGAYLFVDRPLVADYTAPQGFERAGEGFRLTLRPASNSTGPPERLTGVLVLDGRPRAGGPVALEVDAPVMPGDPGPAPPQPNRAPAPVTAQALALAAIFCLLVLGGALLLRRARSSRGPDAPPPGIGGGGSGV